MPAFTPAQMLCETSPSPNPAEPNRCLWISEPGGLTQFGAYVEVLQPGAVSARPHWHSAEDEMVYVLEGEITLIEGDTTSLLHPGDAATFKAGVAVGHCLHNRSTAPTRCLVVGTRAPQDRVTYPGLDRVCVRDRSLLDDVWEDGEGRSVESPF